MTSMISATRTGLGSLSPLEKLIATARAVFPQAQAIQSMTPTGDAKEVWRRLALAAKVDDWALARSLGRELGLPVAETLSAKPSALSLVPAALARKSLILPLEEREHTLVVATGLPFPGDVLDAVRFASGRTIECMLAPPEYIELAVHSAYSGKIDKATSELLIPESTGLAGDDGGHAIVRLANALMLDALRMRASDLHIQPFLRGCAVRARIDGVLRRIALLPDGVDEYLIRYFKAHSKMDPTTSNVPQDGRMSLQFEGRQIDMRLSALPANGGERLVIRFLDQSKIYKLSGSGFSLTALHSMRLMLSNASGLVLLTGPTGSGKTTTLYAMLSEINQVGRNIITIENPVEYRMIGVSQVDINDQAGLTFPKVLRSCLRQDPDVLLIGEIRDAETAEIAIQAAITGHLVLSTLHTNDAVTSVPRLLGLGVPASVLADALSGVVAQRLVRCLCQSCRTPVAEPMTEEESLFKELSRISPTYRAVGCDACGFSGYRGRVPILEIFEVTGAIAEKIGQGVSSSEQLRSENQGKERSLAASAARLVVSGDTTVSEAVRVIGREFWADLAREFGSKMPSAIPVVREGHKDGQAVLLISDDDGFSQSLKTELGVSHVRLLTSGNADDAAQLLRENEDVMFVVVDLGEASDADNVARISQARVAMAWSWLPALILLPPGHDHLREKLLEDGAVSEMLAKPVDARRVCERILARDTSFSLRRSGATSG